MHSQYNPFKENRAEQMQDLWKYYVPIPAIDDSAKPIVVEGGRGSGKTMLFQCNSWKERLSESKIAGKNAQSILTEYPFVGLYYRVDTTFVSSMQGKDTDQWPQIFETYFAICILQEILELFSVLQAEVPFDDIGVRDFVKGFATRVHPSSEVETVPELKYEIQTHLDTIEDLINGANHLEGFRFVKALRYITDLCNSVNTLLPKPVLFKIFIDEYETLQEYQQEIVNTFLKHSTPPIIFNIGLRPQGMKSKRTISKTETIESPHDYESISLAIEENDYLEIIKEICRKRIALGKELGRIPREASDDIEHYLGHYSVDDEISMLSSQRTPSFLVDLKSLIRALGENEKLDKDTIDLYVRVLCEEAPLINAKLHHVLLVKKTTYTPSLTDLYTAYTENSGKYVDWMHNRKFGLVFLLAKDYKRRKLYYGLNVFAALSSHIVRYFLELCEQTFRMAFLSGYNWDKPIDTQTQTDAAYYVGEYKVIDITTYEPYGTELRIFVQHLGHIFYRLHTSSSTTVGEPEPNHFSTKDLALSEKTKRLLSSAIMWNVLQTGEPTKRKDSMLSPETLDYYLNKIYVPYFSISYRNQRKITLKPEILDQLLSGDVNTAKKAVQGYFNDADNIIDIESEPKTKQISLFESV